MQEKNFIGRFSQKIDTTENWDSVADTFVPLKGEIIVYQDDPTSVSSKIKIGDGETPVGSLGFFAGGIRGDINMEWNDIYNVENFTGSNIQGQNVHISDEQATKGAYITYGANLDDDLNTAVLEFWGSMGDQYTVLRHIAPGVEVDDAVTVGQMDGKIGNIESALDAIIAIQEELMGGSGEMITFYIDDVEYTTENETTWGDFLSESEVHFVCACEDGHRITRTPYNTGCCGDCSVMDGDETCENADVIRDGGYYELGLI